MLKDNINLSTDMSINIARVTRNFFYQRMLEELSQEEALHIKQSKEPIIDRYGRVTFTYCELAGTQIPILQPGAFRYESGMKLDGNLAVVDEDGS